MDLDPDQPDGVGGCEDYGGGGEGEGGEGGHLHQHQGHHHQPPGEGLHIIFPKSGDAGTQDAIFPLNCAHLF